MTLSGHTVSRHFFRRTARTHATRLKREGLAAGVEKAKRGPFMWSCVIYEKKLTVGERARLRDGPYAVTTSSSGVPVHHWR